MIEKQESINIKSKFVDKSGKIMLVELNGYLDQTNSDYLQKIIDDIYVSECYNVIFDMNELDYVSSAGWGIFVGEVARFREMGGDIKLIRMSPEIYRLFEMLEFYHIIDSFDDLETCLKSYNHRMEDIVQEEKKETKKLKVAKELLGSKEESQKKAETSIKNNENGGTAKHKKAMTKVSKEISDEEALELLSVPKRIIPLEKMPIQEKIKRIISEYPLISIFKIKKILKHKKFGEEKINLIKLYFILREMHLETKEKRFRFFRSI
ncbi:MAG: hypothetical protein Kow00108_00290 [Calditrichia bacterium]